MHTPPEGSLRELSYRATEPRRFRHVQHSIDTLDLLGGDVVSETLTSSTIRDLVFNRVDTVTMEMTTKTVAQRMQWRRPTCIVYGH